MSALAPSPARPDALLTPVAPGEAYAADVARLNGREPLGAADDAWLALAHALARAATLPAAQRAPLFIAGADSVRALLPDDAPIALRSALGAAADELRRCAARLGRQGPADGAAEAVPAVQQVVAQQEQAGAFLLAFSTLAALRTALAPLLDARGEGLLLAQQGRVARQLGALSTAAQLYQSAVRAAGVARAPDVAARAFIGGGVLARMRGNYPEACDLFRRGLRAAERADDAELRRAAHHGLLGAAFAAGDLDTALAHGWAAVRGLSDDAADERAEVLLNLGEVGRQAGAHRAALGACLSAIELTDLARLRLPALGTAALAAAHLGEHRLLAFLARDVERTVMRSGQPWENARALVELAEALLATEPGAAAEYATWAEGLARTGGFHEITARVEGVHAQAAGRHDAALRRGRPHATPGRPAPGESGAPAAPAAPAFVRSPRARAVLRSLEALPAVGRYGATRA